MPYNLTNLTNTTNLYQFGNEVNKLTNGGYYSMFMIVGFIIVFSSMKRFGVKDSFAATSFLFAILGVLLWTAQLISELIMFAFIVLAALGSVMLFANQN